MRRSWGRLGGRLGTAVMLAGGVVIFLGWNGAAGHDRVPAQFPYLISGGLGGLALVVVGAALVVADGARRDRAALQAGLDDLRRAVEDLAAARRAGGGAVVAGRSSYHRPACRLVEGRTALPTLTPAEAAGRGLAPCRVCHPPGGAA